MCYLSGLSSGKGFNKHKRTVYLLVYADKRGRFSYLTKAFHVTALAGLEKTDVILRCKSVPEELLVG